MPPKKKAAPKKGKNSVEGEMKMYRCIMCGKEVTNPEKVFYKLVYSPIHKGNDTYSHICTGCVKEEFERYKSKHGQEFAVMVICAYLNVPYYKAVYESVNKQQDNFSFGYYLRQMNSKQYQNKTFATTLYEGELDRTKREVEQEAEELSEKNWTVDEKRAKNEVIKLMGYDPFDGYKPKDRKVLFVQLLDYLGDDELLSDNYKLNQVIQIINNNNQINQYDLAISRCDVTRDVDEIETYNGLKKALVMSNEKIAKENGISVNSRGGNTVGKGTLTGLMRDMRDKDLKEVEVNFYNQLRSENSRWAANVSVQSLMENCVFDENDVNEIIDEQRRLLEQAQGENDDLQEQKRLLEVKKYEQQSYIEKLEAEVSRLGGKVGEELLDG